MQKQSVGCGQQDLEEDEQVEQVAGQEGAVQPHEQELEKAVEMRAGAMPAGHREGQRRGGEHRGEEQHQRRQPVEHEHDAERRRPVAEQVGDRPRRGDGVSASLKRTSGDDQKSRGGGEVERPP